MKGAVYRGAMYDYNDGVRQKPLALHYLILQDKFYRMPQTEKANLIMTNQDKSIIL